jgi:aerobic C4-dicarboxylate transport protein
VATNDWIKALGDGFIRLIKMVIAPIIFFTVVSGIAHIQDARKVGRVGVKPTKQLPQWLAMRLPFD